MEIHRNYSPDRVEYKILESLGGKARVLPYLREALSSTGISRLLLVKRQVIRRDHGRIPAGNRHGQPDLDSRVHRRGWGHEAAERGKRAQEPRPPFARAIILKCSIFHHIAVHESILRL
jgi:hypothetical protein